MIHTSNKPDENFSVFSPSDKVEQLKLCILEERLQMSKPEISALLTRIKNESADQLGIPAEAIHIDFEFNGRNIDFIITAALQNLPPIRTHKS